MSAKADGRGAGRFPATSVTDWRETYRELAGRDLAALEAPDLERLGEAAFWTGQPREAIAARRRAYAAHRDTGNQAAATRIAWLLFYNHFDLDEVAAAGGWLKRAQRHATELGDTVEEGYVAVAEADWALYRGELEEAGENARRATDVGRRHADHDLTALAGATEGRILVDGGQISEGLALLDEVMVAAAADELSPFVTGWVYCLLLYTCQEVGDLRRASEWTEAAMRWSEARGEESWYPGLCQLHHCEVRTLRGDWSSAEEDALRAAAELAPFGDYLVAEGHYLAGEIRLRRGDVAGAEDAFRRAHELGRDPQPGMALARLAQGDPNSAANTLRLALGSGEGTPLRRARLLAAHVDSELATGNVDAAAESAARLEDLAQHAGVMMLSALAARARGEVLLAQDDADGALPVLQEACSIYRELSCPYEIAETRILVGSAARRAGDEDTARLEFQAALATFERLGAEPAAERARGLLQRRSTRPRGLTEREVEVLALVARGKTNREVAEALFISEHTVARHLSNIFRKIDVASRSAATAFAFEHQLV